VPPSTPSRSTTPLVPLREAPSDAVTWGIEGVYEP
jgi:hypothetical protein